MRKEWLGVDLASMTILLVDPLRTTDYADTVLHDKCVIVCFSLGVPIVSLVKVSRTS